MRFVGTFKYCLLLKDSLFQILLNNESCILKYGSIFPLKAVAVLHGETKDPIKNQSYSIIGSVSFYQYELLDNITVTVDIFGLPPHNVEAGLLRGLHIHTYGIVNVTSDVKSSKFMALLGLKCMNNGCEV